MQVATASRGADPWPVTEKSAGITAASVVSLGAGACQALESTCCPCPSSADAAPNPYQPARQHPRRVHCTATSRRSTQQLPKVQHAPLKPSTRGGHSAVVTTGVTAALMDSWASSLAAQHRPPPGPAASQPWQPHSGARWALPRCGSSGGGSVHTTPVVRTPNPSTELPASAAAAALASLRDRATAAAAAAAQQQQQQACAPAAGTQRRGPARQAQGLLKAVLRRAALRRCQLALRQHVEGRREAAAAAAVAAVDGGSTSAGVR